jgi:hypothetical protein
MSIVSYKAKEPLTMSPSRCYPNHKYIGEERVVCTVTVSSISTITAMGLALAVGVLGTVTLIALLTIKELAAVQSSPVSRLVARFSDVGILPMMVAFAVTVAIKVAEMLA